MAHDATWEGLVVERAALRSRLVETLHALDARAADPLGLVEVIRRHPYVAAGGAAAAGAVLVQLLVPERDGERAEGGGRGGSDAVSLLMDTVRDAAVRVATPYVVEFVTRQRCRDATRSASAE